MEAAYLDSLHKTTAKIFSARLHWSPTGLNPNRPSTNWRKQLCREIQEKFTLGQVWPSSTAPRNWRLSLRLRHSRSQILPPNSCSMMLLLLTPALGNMHRKQRPSVARQIYLGSFKEPWKFLEIGAVRSWPSVAAQVPGAPSYRPPDS